MITMGVNASIATVFDEREARSATTTQEAQKAMIAFIKEGLDPHSRHSIAERSKGYDLYLPWLMEIIEYVAPLEGKDPLPIPKLHRLYMDAAWDMVMQGLLRPGPKSMAGGADPNAYGRAYSLRDDVEI